MARHVLVAIEGDTLVDAAGFESARCATSTRGVKRHFVPSTAAILRAWEYLITVDLGNGMLAVCGRQAKVGGSLSPPAAG
jgi:hypothetical protein